MNDVGKVGFAFLRFPGCDLCGQHLVEKCITSGNLKFPTIIKMRLLTVDKMETLPGPHSVPLMGLSWSVTTV